MFLCFKKIIDKKYILVELNYMLKNLQKLIFPFLTDCLIPGAGFFLRQTFFDSFLALLLCSVFTGRLSAIQHTKAHQPSHNRQNHFFQPKPPFLGLPTI
jgi:hypothetical protein